MVTEEDKYSKAFTEVFAWGANQHGQLGIDSLEQFIDVPRLCSFNVLIKSVYCGHAHAAILTNEGNLYMMGSNA